VSGREMLQQAFASLEVDSAHTEAVLLLRDGSRLCFCHRVGERWAKAGGPTAEQVLARMALFRLNAKHLVVQFDDGSEWEERLLKCPGTAPPSDGPR
jgi:hypothetical protein